MFEIKSEPVIFLVYLKPQCIGVWYKKSNCNSHPKVCKPNITRYAEIEEMQNILEFWDNALSVVMRPM